MTKPNLYAALLGWKTDENNLMEDHQVVYVVAENEEQAREQAKEKWESVEDPHVDGLQKLNSIDWYKINLEKIENQGDNIKVNPGYFK